MQAFKKGTQNFAPPVHLSDGSKALWSRLVPVRAKSAGRLAIIETALQARDRADAASKIIATEGMVTKTKKTGAVHLHPLLRVERENRSLFTKLFGQLHLSWDPMLDRDAVADD